MFIACILDVACHHLSQHHVGLGISSRSEEPHHGQLSLFLLLFVFVCTFCTAGLYGASVGLGSGVRMGTGEGSWVEPESKSGQHCILWFMSFVSVDFGMNAPALCCVLPMFTVGPP